MPVITQEDFRQAKKSLRLHHLKVLHAKLSGVPYEDLEVMVLVRMPRSKKRRIRKKWRKDLRNYIVDTPELKIT